MKNGFLDLETTERDGLTVPSGRKPYGVIALCAAVALIGGYNTWAVQGSRSMLSAQQAVIGRLSGEVKGLSTENGRLGTQLADTRSRLEESAKRLAAADATANRARVLAAEGRSEAQRSSKQLAAELGAQQTEVETLAGAVDGIKTDGDRTRAGVDKALGDLLGHATLIARNHEGLETLKRMGLRDYFEFDLRKSKRFTRVGPLALRLNKTDRGHQRYTVTVVVDDKRVEKKDNALLEPVQFYVPGTRGVLEVVAAEIEDGRVVGYVSSPKEPAPIS